MMGRKRNKFACDTWFKKEEIEVFPKGRVMLSAKFTVADFLQKLCQKAYYGIEGEKPIAVIAALKYLYEKKLTGKRLLELLDESQVKEIFKDLAYRYSRISNPSTSWDVITGKNKELQNAIMKSANVDEAFSKLTLEEIKSLLDIYTQRLEKTTQTASDAKGEKTSRAPLRYSFKEAAQVLGHLLEEIERAIGESPSFSHTDIIESFAKLDWKTEVPLIGQYRCDALKEKVAVEIEATDKSSVIDTLHRDFFRFLILYRMGKIKAGVLITRASGGEVNFQKVIDELELYGIYYEAPLFIVGLYSK